MKAFLKDLPLKKETIASLSRLDVGDLWELASYIKAAGESLNAYIPNSELTRLKQHLGKQLSPEQVRKLSMPEPKFSLGARLEPRSPENQAR
jgi:hypothetical protein